MQFNFGDHVIRNPAPWKPDDFDSWGRRRGIGEVGESPFPLEPGTVDVHWPDGRCFEEVAGLLWAPVSQLSGRDV